MDNYEYDFLVVGSGIAGLCFAIHASQFGSVLMITKKHDSESNTNYAQGGIACVLDKNDSFERHIEDTLNAGKGLCDPDSVRTVVEKGPTRIKELLQWGASFSKAPDAQNPYDLHLGKEGGHSAKRIVHSKDLTGKEIEATLLNTLHLKKNVTLFQNHCAVELITEHHLKNNSTRSKCYGAYILDSRKRSIFSVRARITCLSTGGAGMVYLHTTNPEIATGDGVAMAYRAGAKISNMEFIQFHPTTLYHENANSFLISEALRGYGAVLRNASGEEFMNRYHTSGSLAPRDIVARAIDNEMKKSGEPCVYLDIRDAKADETIKHFPNIYQKCLSFGIDITKDLIPVVPAAHYLCGGILVDHCGKTTIENLYACGESACTGVHGANRLASNSLLEALVFSYKSAYDAASRIKDISIPQVSEIPDWDDSGTHDNEEWILLSHNLTEIQSVMWDYVGIVRSNLRLHRALRRINLLEKEIENFYKKTKITSRLLELRNIVTTSKLIILSALKRKESRGLHYTTDHPNQNDRYWKRNTILEKK
ncbi:L-aspartate oxidase [Chitinispirillales bacterium ANBcel5]|uniref:L-aspartate oxidase n=1 Tax=Cellulosispirillum alkaliphilum TaxID=3039283 RepID=UPI002A54078D|nr:L-aspartate oxidase [Chitinispirillales bacterium ANBcel5]